MNIFLLLVAFGIAKPYDQGVMEHTMKVRGMHKPPVATALISRVDCSTIGQLWNMRVNGHREIGYQVDCSEYRDAPRHRKEGLIAELDYKTGKRDGVFNFKNHAAPVVVWAYR